MVTKGSRFKFRPPKATLPSMCYLTISREDFLGPRYSEDIKAASGDAKHTKNKVVSPSTASLTTQTDSHPHLERRQNWQDTDSGRHGRMSSPESDAKSVSSDLLSLSENRLLGNLNGEITTESITFGETSSSEQPVAENQSVQTLRNGCLLATSASDAQCTAKHGGYAKSFQRSKTMMYRLCEHGGYAKSFQRSKTTMQGSFENILTGRMHDYPCCDPSHIPWQGKQTERVVCKSGKRSGQGK